MVERLQPVSFVYNQGDGRVRYGFIAEDTAAIDAHLATYDASGAVSGIDDRSILAILVNAIKALGATVVDGVTHFVQLAADKFTTHELCVDDICVTRDQFAEVFGNSQSAAAAGTPSSSEVPGGSSTSSPAVDADTATTTTPSEPAAGVPDPGGFETPVSSSADAPSSSSSDNDLTAGAGSVGPSAAPGGASASEGAPDAEASTASTSDDTSALIEVNQPNEPVTEEPAAQAPEPAPELEAVNDNSPTDQEAATGTE